MKRKFVQSLLFVGIVFYAVYCIRDLGHMVGHMARQNQMRDLTSRLASVTNRLENIAPGLPRAQEFIQRLKAVDSSHAPQEVRDALQDYIAQLQGSVEAMKAGKDVSSYDASMPQSKEKLRAAIQKYD